MEGQGLTRPASSPPRPYSGDQYRASRNTVRDAIKWLTTRALVETRPGQGAFITETIQPVTTLTELRLAGAPRSTWPESRRPLTPVAIHRWNAVVAADHVLPHKPDAGERHPAHPAEKHQRGSCRLARLRV
jgi:hypothetical protein